MNEADALAELVFYLACIVAGLFAGTYGTRYLINNIFKGWMLILLRPNKAAMVYTLGGKNENKDNSKNNQKQNL